MHMYFVATTARPAFYVEARSIESAAQKAREILGFYVSPELDVARVGDLLAAEIRGDIDVVPVRAER